MKTLGLIGGTSWASTADYYKIINQQINERLGGLNSAKHFLYSLNFEEFKPPADPDDWGNIASDFSGIAKGLQNAGAECIILCANTPHMIADIIQLNIDIPLINIAEETAKEIAKQKITNVGLLGTKLVMEQPFYKKRLSNYGISTLVPNEEDRKFIHTSIFEEFARGIFKKNKKEKYLQIIEELIEHGARGIIFGCTEIILLIQPEEVTVPVFDTTWIHASAAVDFALNS